MTDCQNESEFQNYMDEGGVMPRNPATEARRTAVPASSTEGQVCTGDQMAMLETAKKLRNALQLDATVQQAMGSDWGRMEDVRVDKCVHTLAYGASSSSPVSLWSPGRHDNTYSASFFQGRDRESDCRRATQLLVASACNANLGGSDCKNARGEIQISNDPDGFKDEYGQNLWTVSMDACK